MFDLVVDQSDFPSTRGIHASRAVVGTQIVGSPKVVRELMDEGVDLEDRRIIGYLFNIWILENKYLKLSLKIQCTYFEMPVTGNKLAHIAVISAYLDLGDVQDPIKNDPSHNLVASFKNSYRI